MRLEHVNMSKPYNWKQIWELFCQIIAYPKGCYKDYYPLVKHELLSGKELMNKTSQTSMNIIKDTTA